MKKFLLIIIFISFSTLVFGNQENEKLYMFKKEVEKLNSYKYNQEYRAKDVKYSFLRYTKHKEDLQRFKNIISDQISNNKNVINKWSKGTFNLLEKKNYGNTEKDYNVYFGNGSVVFKENNFLLEESVYIMTQFPIEPEHYSGSYLCIDGMPVDKYWKTEEIYAHPGIVRIKELEEENFYVFPYFDEKEPSIAVYVGWTSPRGNGGGYFIIFSTISNKYYISNIQGCGDMPSEIPNNANK